MHFGNMPRCKHGKIWRPLASGHKVCDVASSVNDGPHVSSGVCPWPWPYPVVFLPVLFPRVEVGNEALLINGPGANEEGDSSCAFAHDEEPEDGDLIAEIESLGSDQMFPAVAGTEHRNAPCEATGPGSQQGQCNSGSQIEDHLEVGGSTPAPSQQATLPVSLQPDSGLWRSSTETSATSTTTAEECILDVVRGLAFHSAEVRDERQRLFDLSAVAAADASADVHASFERLVLVGSTALGIDTPSSDLDAVVLIQHGRVMTLEKQVELLSMMARKIQAADDSLAVQVVACARVPILSAAVTAMGLSIDVSINQHLPLHHLRWFEGFMVTPPCPLPLSRVPTPVCEGEATVEALLLRCVKWWLVRRALPTTKQGGFPTIVWLLMAAHVQQRAVVIDLEHTRSPLDYMSGRPTRRLLRFLKAFFNQFCSAKGFQGTISFTADGSPHFEPLSGQADAISQNASSSATEDNTFYVGGLPATVSESVLRDYFSRFGEVLSATLLRDKETGHSRGSAFITMTCPRTKDVVLATYKHAALGAKVWVNNLRREKTDSRRIRRPKFWVGNLPFTANNEDVRQYFGTFGGVHRVDVVNNPSTGRSRGFAYMVMVDEAAGAAVAACDRHSMKGRQLQLQARASEHCTVVDGCPTSSKSTSHLLSSFSVLDPMAGDDLAPKISLATQLLHIYELRRAAAILSGSWHWKKAASGNGSGRSRIRAMFTDVQFGSNLLPSIWPVSPSVGASHDDGDELIGGIFLRRSKNILGEQLVLGVIRSVKPRASWTAPFLHRRDTYSQVRVALCDVEDCMEEGITEGCAICRVQDASVEVDFAPCAFVCRVALIEAKELHLGSKLEAPMTRWLLCGESLLRYRRMLDYLASEHSPSTIPI